MVELENVSTLVETLKMHAEALNRHSLALDRWVSAKHGSKAEKEFKLEAKVAPDKSPRWVKLVEKLHQIYESNKSAKHVASEIDFAALKRLMARVSDDDEIARRWDFGLMATGYRSCTKFAELEHKWNGLVPDASRAAVKTNTIENKPGRRM